MTASISYAPLAHGLSLDVGGAPGFFVRNMEKVFGGLPCTLNKTDIPKLEVLANLWDQPIDNPYEHLINVIKQNGPIKVWATY